MVTSEDILVEEIPPWMPPGVGSSSSSCSGLMTPRSTKEFARVPVLADPEAQNQRCKFKDATLHRVVAIPLGIVTLIATIGFCYSKFSNHRGMYVTGSHLGFTNYIFLPTDSSFQAPDLCNKFVVRKSCLYMLTESQELNRRYALTVDQLSRLFFASKSSVRQFLSGLALESDFEATGVQCQELCEAVVASFPPKHLPSRGDVGCVEIAGSATPVCNVDLSWKSLKNISFKGLGQGLDTWELSHEEESASLPVDVRKLGAAVDEEEEILDSGSSSVTEELQSPDVSFKALQYAVANSFHIFPLKTKPQAQLRTLQDAVESTSVVENEQTPIRALSAGEVNDANRIADLSNALSVKTLEALAAIQTNSKIDNVFRKWFGISDGLTVGEIRRTLRGMIGVFNNLVFIPNGPSCRDSFYAYVNSRGPKNKNSDGQYIINLCNNFFGSDENEKIETIIHESSHHEPMYTLDVEYAGSTLYGGEKCQNAAKDCAGQNNPASEPCKGTRKNADSLAFFVADANDRFDPDDELGFVEDVEQQIEELAEKIGVHPTVLYVGTSIVLCGTAFFCCCILWSMCKCVKTYDRGYSVR